MSLHAPPPDAGPAGYLEVSAVPVESYMVFEAPDAPTAQLPGNHGQDVLSSSEMGYSEVVAYADLPSAYAEVSPHHAQYGALPRAADADGTAEPHPGGQTGVGIVNDHYVAGPSAPPASAVGIDNEHYEAQGVRAMLGMQNDLYSPVAAECAAAAVPRMPNALYDAHAAKRGTDATYQDAADLGVSGDLFFCVNDFSCRSSAQLSTSLTMRWERLRIGHGDGRRTLPRHAARRWGLARTGVFLLLMLIAVRCFTLLPGVAR